MAATTRAESSTTEAALEPTVTGQPDLWRQIRWILLAGYAAILGVSIIVVGIPLDRVGMTLWILAGLAVFSVGRGWRAFGRILVDWLPFTGILIAYDFTRGLADGLGMPLHITEPIHFDEWLFGGTLPTVWLQEHFYVPGQVHWYEVVGSLIYFSHFLAMPIAATVLWIRNRARFRGFIGRILALAILGVSTYILYPMAPPWMASEMGLVPLLDRISSIGWSAIGLDFAGSMLKTGQAQVNQVAAMPSLHAAYAALVAAFFCMGARWWVKALLMLYPIAMGITLVYSGEHYVIDVLAGYLYVVVIMLAAPRVSRLIRALRDRRAARRVEPDAGRTDVLAGRADGAAEQTPH